MVYVEDEKSQEISATALSRPLVLDGTVNLDYVEDAPISSFHAFIDWLRRLLISS